MNFKHKHKAPGKEYDKFFHPSVGDLLTQTCSQQGSNQVKTLSVVPSLLSFISIAGRFVARNAIGGSIDA